MIPVDFLVERIGDKLKIVISNIYFKAFTADFQDVEPELAEKNMRTLDRLAEVHLPLSIERAQAIKEALVTRGITEGRMSVEGFGGTQPVVPHSDLDNRWKNRRVEFILQK